MSKVGAGILTLLCGAIGQLCARIIWLNGSLDKEWLFAFFFFPLSIVSSIWFFAGWVDEGEGSDPIDVYAYLLPLLSLTFAVIFDSLCDMNEFLGFWIYLMTMILFYGMCRYLKRVDVCDEEGYSMSQSFYTAFIVNFFVAFANVMTIILEKVFKMMGRIPYVGPVFMVLSVIMTIWNYLDYIPGLQHGIGLSFANILQNMKANTPDAQEKFCSTKTGMWTNKWWTWCLIAYCGTSSLVKIKDLVP